MTDLFANVCFGGGLATAPSPVEVQAHTFIRTGNI